MRPKSEIDVARFGGLEYRVGDLVYGYFNKLNVTHLFCNHWPSSIGCRYAQSRRKTPDFDALSRLVKGGETPPSNVLILHVRTGDVIDWPLYRNKYRCHTGCRWVRPISVYARACIPCAIEHIQIVSKPNHRTEGVKSRAYLLELERLFKSYGYSVSMRTNFSADDDLRYIANARYLLPGLGRFGHIAERMARNATLINFTCSSKMKNCRAAL